MSFQIDIAKNSAKRRKSRLDLQEAFLRLVDIVRRGGPPSRLLPLHRDVVDNAAFSKPAFYFEQYVPVPKGGVRPAPEQDGDIALPFDAFWCLYLTTNGALPDNLNAVYYDGRGDAPKLYFALNGLGQWMFSPSYTIGDELSDKPLVVQEYVPEFYYCLGLLNQHDHETEETDALRTFNAGRAKSRKLILNPIPPFIIVRNDREQRYHAANDRMGDTGSPRAPHDRRGHIRRLASGKLVNVRPSKIHGGADEARNYRVG